MDDGGDQDDVAFRILEAPQDRYATLDLIHWWQRDRVRDSTVLVAGAGALGNEVLKNLALLGFGRILIVDFDTIEAANLSRSLLFRQEDEGKNKAEVAADAVQRLNPDVAVRWIHGDVTQVLGTGVFRHVDAVVGCLDNREARLFVNRACYRVGRPWIDGALHEMLGEARVFHPGRGACYECTLTDADYRAINARYSCSALRRDLFLSGKIATTTTIAAIIGAIQVQEVLKQIHGLAQEPGKALVFNGLTNEVYTTAHPIKDDCLSHQSFERIHECPALSARGSTVADLLRHVRGRLGPEAWVELDFDLLIGFDCPHGHPFEEVLRPVGSVAEPGALCPVCDAFRWPQQTYVLRGDEPFRQRTLADLGVAPLHILCGRTKGRCYYFELTGDRGSIFDFR